MVCLTNSAQADNLLVRLGGIDFASYDEKFVDSKVQVFPHPKFNVQTQQYDIALLKVFVVMRVIEQLLLTTSL